MYIFKGNWGRTVILTSKYCVKLTKFDEIENGFHNHITIFKNIVIIHIK